MHCSICDTIVPQVEVQYDERTGKFDPVCYTCKTAIEHDILDIEEDMDYNVHVDVEELADEGFGG